MTRNTRKMVAAWIVCGLVLVPATQAVSAPAAAETEAKSDDTMVDSPFFQLGWPEIKMPKFSWKSNDKAAPPTADSQENPVSRALDRVASSSRKASDSVRNAWGSAVRKIQSLGRSDDTTGAVAKKDDKPGFWSRLFAPEEPQQSQTVQEFLAQERVGTTR